MPAVPGVPAPLLSGLEHTFLNTVHHQKQHGDERQQQNSDQYHDAPLSDSRRRVLRTRPLMGSVK